MLPIGALFAFVGRQVGRLVQLAFNWATLVLFGQVAKDKQLFLSLMALFALVWPIALAGVAIPSVGTFLLGFVTVPAWLDLWVRVAMLALALLAPLAVGFLAIKLRDQAPRGLSYVRALLAGYPNALALAVVLLWLMIVTPIMQLIAVAHRHDSAHIPISVKPGGYDTVVDDLRAALERAGLVVRHTFAPWPLTLPGRILALVGGAGVRALVPQHLSQLRAHDFVMTVHPMDLTLPLDYAAIERILPHRYPFLLVDRIIEVEEQKRIVGIKNVTINEPFFQGHFPGHPVMPGVLIIEAMAQVGGMLLMGTVDDPHNKVVYFIALDNVRWRRPVKPGDQLRFELEVVQIRGSVCKMRGVAKVDGELAAEADMAAMVRDR